MRVDLEQNGTLVLYPESGLESYALMKWMDDLENRVVTIRVAPLDGDDD